MFCMIRAAPRTIPNPVNRVGTSRLLTIFLALSSAVPVAIFAQQKMSLPDPTKLLAEVKHVQDEYSKVRAKYLCVDTEIINHYGYNGFRTDQQSLQYETFYIHGLPIIRMTSMNGRTLSPTEKAAEDARVDAEIAKANQADEKPIEWSDTLEGKVLQISDFTGERRLVHDGRDIIAFDFSGTKSFKPHSQLELIARSLKGYIWIDEKDRVIYRMDGAVAADVMEHGKLLVPKQIPLITFTAVRVNDELFLPQLRTSFKFQPVDKGPDQWNRWNTTLERRFDQIVSCRVFHVDSKIVP
jgi:hypothetical protein